MQRVAQGCALPRLSLSWQPKRIVNNIEPSEVLERTAFFERVMMVVETAAMVAFAISSLVIIPDLIAAANIHGTASLWLLALVPLAHVAADVFTGFMHFFSDNFFSPDTPIVGPAFV